MKIPEEIRDLKAGQNSSIKDAEMTAAESHRLLLAMAAKFKRKSAKRKRNQEYKEEMRKACIAEGFRRREKNRRLKRERLEERREKTDQ